MPRVVINEPHSGALFSRAVELAGKFLSVMPVYNPIQFVFEAEETGVGSNKATVSISCSPFTLLDGQYIEIAGRRFTARTLPQSGDLQAGITGYANGERLYQLVSEDPFLSDLFDFDFNDIAGPTFVILLTSKFAGTAYNFPVVVNAPPPSALAAFQTGGANANIAQGYEDWGVYVKVFVSENESLSEDITVYASPVQAQWKELGIYQISYQDGNRLPFDKIGELLSAYTKTYAPKILPTVGNLLSAGGLFAAPETLRRYYIEYGENYTPVGETSPRRFRVGTLGLEDTPPVLGYPQMFWVHNSALPQAHSPNLSNGAGRAFQNFWRSWFTPEIFPTVVEFLTQSPNPKETTVDSIELLYFIFTKSLVRPNLAIRYDVTFVDGTTSQNNYVPLTGTILQTCLYVESGYRRLKTSFPAIDTTKAIETFTVQIVEYDTTPSVSLNVTWPKTYRLRRDLVCLAYRRPQLIFLNPLSGYDTLYCSGLQDRDVEAKRDSYMTDQRWVYIDTRKQYQSALENSPSENVFAFDEISQKRQTGTNAMATYVVRTGSYPMDHVRWIQDSLFTSNKIYILDWQDFDNVGNPQLQQLRQVILTKASAPTQVETDLYEIELECELCLPIASVER